MQFVLEQGWEYSSTAAEDTGTGSGPELDPTSFQNGW